MQKMLRSLFVRVLIDSQLSNSCKIAARVLAVTLPQNLTGEKSTLVNPLRAKFFRENINIYLHFMSFLHTNKTHVVEIPRRVRQGPT